MEQIKKFLRDKGFALALLACLVAAGAAGVWAVRAVRDELKQDYESLTQPGASAAPQQAPDDLKVEEDELWQDVTETADSVAGVPKPEPASDSSGASSGDDPVCHSCLSVHWDRDCWRISGYVSGYGNVVYFADSIYPALLFSGELGAEDVRFV